MATIGRAGALLVALAFAGAAWLPAMHLAYEPRVSDYLTPSGLAAAARMRQLAA